jgi:ascorbate-specific PTS system EIIC-type component UlaA
MPHGERLQLCQKLVLMSNTVVYTIVVISLLHFVAAIVFLLRKMSGPPKGDGPTANSDPDKHHR